MSLRVCLLVVVLLGVWQNAESKSHKHHGLSKLHTNSSTSHLSGSKRTWECHRGCLQFCLPSCKKSCCKPGAKDFTSTMIDQIEKYQGEMKGVAEARNDIQDDDSEEIQPFACGQFCSPECSPSCTIGCCTEMVPKDDTNTPKHSGYGIARALHVLHQKPPETPEPVPAPKLQDIQKMLEMPCGDACSAHCSPACTQDCCNSWTKKMEGSAEQRQVISTSNTLPSTKHRRPKVMDMYKKAISTCHIDCEKLCLPACEFVCCVPSKMREIRFTKDVEMRFGLRKTLD
jgi:hypothetical protein